jgi:hypothetical protein
MIDHTDTIRKTVITGHTIRSATITETDIIRTTTAVIRTTTAMAVAIED